MTQETLAEKAKAAMKNRGTVTMEDIANLKRQISEIVGYFPSLYLDAIFPEVANKPANVRNGLFLMRSQNDHPSSEIWLSETGELVEVYRDAEKAVPRTGENDIILILRNHGGLSGMVRAIGDALDELGSRGTRQPDRNHPHRSPRT